MTDWYKMNPVDWNDGTDDLTLEQEGAYLRICNAIYISERPIRDNMFVVAGLLRCSDRKARRLVDDLVKAGKLVIEDGHIVNRRAVDEVSARVRLRMERQSNGSRGGVKSAETRAKQLKTNDVPQANASSKNEAEEIRLEERREPLTPSKKFANPSVILQGEVDVMTAQHFASHCEEKHKPLSSQQAEGICAVLREVRSLGGNPAEALKLAIRRGWVSLEIEYLRNQGFPFKVAPAAASVDWAARIAAWRIDPSDWIHAWGPKPDETGCKAPSELLRQAA
jgi:uncharacterized protein YdaU (DUF1376 family)